MNLHFSTAGRIVAQLLSTFPKRGISLARITRWGSNASDHSRICRRISQLKTSTMGGFVLLWWKRIRSFELHRALLVEGGASPRRMEKPAVWQNSGMTPSASQGHSKSRVVQAPSCFWSIPGFIALYGCTQFTTYSHPARPRARSGLPRDLKIGSGRAATIEPPHLPVHSAGR
jgi:hypothetical protein